MTKWLYDRFVEKEKLLETFYKTGEFPTDGFCTSPIPPQEVSQDCLRFAILHLFFITSSYIHFQLLSYVVSYFWYWSWLSCLITFSSHIAELFAQLIYKQKSQLQQFILILVKYEYNIQPWKPSEFWKHGKSLQMTVMQKTAAVTTWYSYGDEIPWPCLCIMAELTAGTVEEIFSKKNGSHWCSHIWVGGTWELIVWSYMQEQTFFLKHRMKYCQIKHLLKRSDVNMIFLVLKDSDSGMLSYLWLKTDTYPASNT